MIDLEGGSFVMGEDGPLAYPGDGEYPRLVTVSGFAVAATAVTNASFATFVAETGHATTAETEGWSFVFGGLLPDEFPDTRGVAAAPWWRQVFGATWRRPEGPHSDIADRGDHPVVHVSWTDATAYSSWAGLRLPTEAEWEYAAAGGIEGTWWWGDELVPPQGHQANVWQGSFPDANTLADGWLGTCPVDTYSANAYGLYNSVGNVWEWTADWFAVDRFGPAAAAGEPIVDPQGPPGGDDKVLKGGSYLCHESYCHRYRRAARSGSTPDSSAGNVGFRCAR